MRFVIFTHSLVSDWNHGNAHFLRGIATELVARGHDVRIFEPADGWSRSNLLSEGGAGAIAAFENVYPLIRSELYDERTLELSRVLRGADIVIVHEWNSPELVRRIGAHHDNDRSYRLYFHDTHHRSATDPAAMSRYDLRHFDGVLAYGGVIRDMYLRHGWAAEAWTWHEAADTRVFRPLPGQRKNTDLVWIGNWGDDERSEELREFLIEPVKALKLTARVYGVRYPQHALEELDAAGIEYCGWLPNYRVPDVFARHRVTVHVPRRPYARTLPGIPTIRPFEALACGIPMISAPWNDSEKLFRLGQDFLIARDGREMVSHLDAVLSDDALARRLAASGLETILARHTCAHRVDELLAIAEKPRDMVVYEEAVLGGAIQ
jgi:spore maturation protein CgeB